MSLIVLQINQVTNLLIYKYTLKRFFAPSAMIKNDLKLKRTLDQNTRLIVFAASIVATDIDLQNKKETIWFLFVNLQSRLKVKPYSQCKEYNGNIQRQSLMNIGRLTIDKQQLKQLQVDFQLNSIFFSYFAAVIMSISPL